MSYAVTAALTEDLAPASETFVAGPPPTIHPLGAREAIFVTDMGRHYTVDFRTGEILASSDPLPRTPPRPVHTSKTVGIDTPWPCMARDEDELREAIQPFDHWLDRHYLEEANLLGLLRTGITGSAIRLLQHLAEQLSGHNYWFGKLKNLSVQLGLSERTVRAALAELERAGLIERTTQGKSWPTRIRIHPWYAWRGDLFDRKRALGEWVKRRVALSSDRQDSAVNLLRSP